LHAVAAAGPARLQGWRIISPAGHRFTGRFVPAAEGDSRVATALALPRHRLDAILVRHAVAAGASLCQVRVDDLLRDDDRVIGVAGRTAAGERVTHRARLVIGADGLRSVVARRAGLAAGVRPPRKLSLTTHVRGVDDPGSFGEMHLAADACLGFAPLEARADPLCNLTLVVDAERHGRHAAGAAAGFFHGWLHRFPELAGRLGGIVPGDPEGGWRFHASGPFHRPVTATTGAGVVLAGDAAGYYDPFTGQGVYQALAGAEALSRCADRALRSSDLSPAAFADYAAAHRRLTAGARRVQRLIEAVIARPSLADAAIRRLAAAPRAADALVAVTGDLRPARSLLHPALLFSLLASSPRRPLRDHHR
jgi:menaquinone-9 beta-reductase